jgi:hypothetical protein
MSWGVLLSLAPMAEITPAASNGKNFPRGAAYFRRVSGIIRVADA